MWVMVTNISFSSHRMNYLCKKVWIHNAINNNKSSSSSSSLIINIIIIASMVVVVGGGKTRTKRQSRLVRSVGGGSQEICDCRVRLLFDVWPALALLHHLRSPSTVPCMLRRILQGVLCHVTLNSSKERFLSASETVDLAPYIVNGFVLPVL